MSRQVAGILKIELQVDNFVDATVVFESLANNFGDIPLDSETDEDEYMEGIKQHPITIHGYGYDLFLVEDSYDFIEALSIDVTENTVVLYSELWNGCGESQDFYETQEQVEKTVAEINKGIDKLNLAFDISVCLYADCGIN